jgi:cell division septum initiation protein DivIVA
MADDVTLVGVLDALEHLVHGARAMPMSSSVLVNRDEVLALVECARADLPDELAHAQEILAGADRVHAEARARAEETLAAARQRAADLVSQEAVVLAAERRAAELVAAARTEAAGLRRDADDYCDRRLADFEIDLGRLLSQVQAGRAKLAARLEHEPPADPDDAGPLWGGA